MNEQSVLVTGRNGIRSITGTLSALIIPLTFALIYGSGFVGAKYGLPYSPPLVFLVLRFVIASVLIALIAKVVGAKWPNTFKEVLHISTAGILTVGTFSAGVFVSLSVGISPALSALIIALQPILVAILAQRMLGEQLSQKQWVGFALGLVGVAFVVGHKVDFNAVGIFGVLMSVVGLLGLTFGNIYQKKYCADMNVFTGGSIQSGATALILVPLALIFEPLQVIWHGEFVMALLYMSVGVSIGALSLLYIMIRRGEVSRVASVFYLVPVSAAIASYLIYGETIDLSVAFGIGVVAMGVFLVNHR